MKRGGKIKTEHRGTKFHIKSSGKEEASQGERGGTTTEVGGKSGECGGLEANKRLCFKKNGMIIPLLYSLSSGI